MIYVYASDYNNAITGVCPPVFVGPKAVILPTNCSEKESPVGSKCIFACSAGYSGSSTIETLECLTTGQWSENIPTCVALVSC